MHEIQVNPTCTVEGSYDEVIYCSECEEELSRTPKTAEKLEHSPAEAVIENEINPTCTALGSYDEVIYCSKCEGEISRTSKSVDMLEHSPAEAVIENEVDPTCAALGNYDEVVYCSKCEGEISRTSKSVDMLEHTFVDKICTECGERAPSEGLYFVLSNNRTSYVVKGIGTCTDTDIVNPQPTTTSLSLK